MGKVYIVRHGETENNKRGRFTGDAESPLTSKGRNQSKRVGLFFGKEKIDKIYSSPIKRSVFVAREISKATGVPFAVDDLLSEMNIGQLKHKTRTEVVRDFPEINLEKIEKYPEGESYTNLQKRAELFIEILEGEINTVVCGHAHFNRMLRARLMKRDFWAQQGQPNNRVYRIDLVNKKEEMFEV